MAEEKAQPAKALGDLLKGIARQARTGRRALTGRRLAQKVFEERFRAYAQHASVASLKLGVVVIEAGSSAVFQELEGFHRQELLQTFRQAGLQVVEVRVKLVE